MIATPRMLQRQHVRNRSLEARNTMPEEPWRSPYRPKVSMSRFDHFAEMSRPRMEPGFSIAPAGRSDGTTIGSNPPATSPRINVSKKYRAYNPLRCPEYALSVQRLVLIINDTCGTTVTPYRDRAIQSGTRQPSTSIQTGQHQQRHPEGRDNRHTAAHAFRGNDNTLTVC